MQYLVARFMDGRVFKGTALGLDSAAGVVRMDVTSGPGESGPTEFQISELKALFGVVDLDGDPKHADWKPPRGPRPADTATVSFKDGEVMVGVIPDYEPGSEFFFLVPADPHSNNVWCYVRASATEGIRFLPPVDPAAQYAIPVVGRAVARVASLAGVMYMRQL